MAAHSGTVQLFAHGLQLPVAPLRMPLDLTLEGSYSPKSIFFRTFRLASDRFSLGGFLLLGGNFVELQAFELTIAGTPRVSGTLFLPFGLERWRESHSFFAAFDADQKFDVDLLIDHLDLAQLGTALGEQSSGSGILDGMLQLMPSARVLVMGQPAMLVPAPGAGPGICQSPEQIPQGPPIVGTVQPRVIAT